MKLFCFYLFFHLSLFAKLFAQEAFPIEINISNAYSTREFSAMTWKGDTLFILEQRNADSFFYTTRNAIKSALNSKVELTLKFMPVFGLKKFADSLNNLKPKMYDGIEACAFIGDAIYVSIETPDGPCYILKGEFNGSAFNFNTGNCLTLPKPYKCEYGYESLVTLPDNMLLAVFETAEDSIHHKAYTFSGSMSDTVSSIISCSSYRKPKGRELRLADICSFNETLIAIDFDFLRNSQCYSKIVQLSKGNGEVVFMQNLVYDAVGKKKKRKGIKCINFEGIAAFENGILAVSDNCPRKGDKTYLYYYKLSLNKPND